MIGSSIAVATCLVLLGVGRRFYRNYYYCCDDDDEDDGFYDASAGDGGGLGGFGKKGGGDGNGSNKNAGDARLPAQLREEQLSRHALYFGRDGTDRLARAKVLVVGLGGVGSHAAHMLARGGVGFLRMVDFDQVTLSSLNRHAVATLDDVGTPKATCLERYLRRICPSNFVWLEAVVEMYTAETGDRILELPPAADGDGDGGWDLVVDAIDDVPTKAVLVSDCLERRIPVLSCMGAGGKSDFTRLHLSELRTAARDPLASKLRQELKKRMSLATANQRRENAVPAASTADSSATKNNGDKKTKSNVDDDAGTVDNADDSYLDDMDRLSVLYSSEKTVVKLADFTEQQREEGVHQFGAIDGMRIRIVPVLGTTPAIFGQALAATALTRIGGKPFQPVTGERVGRNVRNKTYQRLKTREDRITKKVLARSGLEEQRPAAVDSVEGTVLGDGGTWIGPLAIDQDDVEYLLELWRNRCAVTGNRLGTVLELVRWDLRRPSSCDNLVLMCSHAIRKYASEDQEANGDGHGGRSLIPEPVRLRIEERLSTCRIDR